MTRFWRLASGLSVFLLALFLSMTLVFGLFLGEPPLPGIANHVLLPFMVCVLIFFSFAGSYLLVRDALKSK